jgi:phosphate transport system substrate-binding protein
MSRAAVLICLVLAGIVCSPRLSAEAAAAGAPAHASVTLNGAGSTFDAPFFNTAFSAYEAKHQVTIGYQAVGSGMGIQQFSAGDVDFAASDVPMTRAEVSVAVKQGGSLLQTPVALGGVAVAYNVSGIKSGLRLTGPVLAAIFLGDITRWNDPAIARLNPRIKLPDFCISVLHRVDSSGTSYIFTDYLSHVSSAWKSRIGAGKVVAWPAGSAGNGNDGVAGLLQTVPGSIGYLELSYVLKYRVTTAMLRNAAGAYIAPSTHGVAAAASAVSHISASHFSIVDPPGAASYPISGYSWIIIHQHGSKVRTLAALMRWLVTSGQAYAAKLDYVALPRPVRSLALTQLAKLT